MAHLEGGWPLGLRPLNARVGLVRTRDLSGSISFSSTLLTGSPTSSAVSSSGLDTDESTGSFFDITLGSLVGVSSILELSRSRRSTRGRRAEENVRDRRNNKPWLFSLCSKQSTDAVNARNTSSLDNFLEAERRSSATASHVYRRRIQSPTSLTISDAANSLIVDGGQVAAPPQSSAPNLSENGGRQSNNFLHGNGCGRMGFYYYSRIRACLDTP